MPQGFSLAAQGITSGPLWDRVAASLLSLDGAEHHRLRRLVSRAFAPRAAARLRTAIVEVITELVEPLTTTGHCEMVAHVARQYPIPIICALLGTPRRDWQLFSSWTDDIMKTFSWHAADEAPEILRAWEALDAYFDDMIAARREALTDDLISELIRAEDDGDRLTHDELLMLAAGLLIAGTDTTRNQLAAAVHVLCDCPDQWALLAERPELAPNAVEEVMRHSPVAAATMRTAIDDVELGGVMIPAGTLIIVNTAAANRDPAVYDDPDRLDITREAPPAMLTFGGGVQRTAATRDYTIFYASKVVATDAISLVLLVECTYSKRALFVRHLIHAPCREVSGVHVGLQPQLHRDARTPVGAASRHEDHSERSSV